MDLRGINFHNANLENADLSDITISKIIQYMAPTEYKQGIGMVPDISKPKCSHPDNVFLNAIYLERCILKVLMNESVRTDFRNANLK